jgi:hypothetical protein
MRDVDVKSSRTSTNSTGDDHGSVPTTITTGGGGGSGGGGSVAGADQRSVGSDGGDLSLTEIDKTKPIV